MSSNEQMQKLRQLQRDRAELVQKATHVSDTADSEKRQFTEQESKDYEKFLGDAENLGNEIKRRQRLLNVRTEFNPDDFKPEPEGDKRDGEGNIGLTEKEIRQYSVLRAIRAARNARHGVRDAWKGAEFELECSQAVESQTGIESKGVYLPFDALGHGSVRSYVRGIGYQYQSRDLNVGTNTAGGNLVATDLMSSSFIDILRNMLVLQRAGATVLSGLQGDIAIPKQTGSATSYWVGESGAPTESQQTIGQVTAVPHTIGAFTDFSRKLLLQSSIDVESMVRGDIAAVIARGIDYAGLHGDSSSDANQPNGIETYADVTSVVGGTNGAAPTWGNVVGLESAVAQDNALMGRVSYITNSKIRGKLKQTEKASNTAKFIFDDDGRINGYGAHVSEQVRKNRTKGSGTNLSTLFFGNFADFVLCLWSGLDILVDPYTHSTSATTRVVGLQDCDWLSRHDESYSAMLDAITS